MKQTPFTKEELKEKIDKIPDGGQTGRIRTHQGWWRLNVLNQKAGLNPVAKDGSTVCNTIESGESSGNNFLTENIKKVVKDTLRSRTSKDGGKIEPNRLYNNLLSSQPLCFNFFGELEADKEFGLKVLQTLWADITKLNKVLFEYSPPDNISKDGSAFDIGFDVSFGKKSGFIGLECKYTDPFSFKPAKSSIYYGDKGNKNYEGYRKVYDDDENRSSFKADYYDFVRNKDYNQLFRNQIMAEAMEGKIYDVVKTGIFCYQGDESTTKSSNKFKKMLAPDKFKVITYTDFISNVQQLELSWKQREWTMMLWARYCGLQLSEEVYNQLSKK